MSLEASAGLVITRQTLDAVSMVSMASLGIDCLGDMAGADCMRMSSAEAFPYQDEFVFIQSGLTLNSFAFCPDRLFYLVKYKVFHYVDKQ